MYRFRTSRFWDLGIFYRADMDAGDKWFAKGAWFVLFGFAGFILTMITGEYNDSGDMVSGHWWLIPLFAFIGLLCASLGKISPMYHVPETYGYGYSSLRPRVRFYLELPPADKTLYPHNILSIVSDPDMTKPQRVQIVEAMLQVENNIIEREKVKKELSRRHIDVDGIVEGLLDSTRSVQSEIDTYKEYM